MKRYTAVYLSPFLLFFGFFHFLDLTSKDFKACRAMKPFKANAFSRDGVKGGDDYFI
jgi:hypothetical protein